MPVDGPFLLRNQPYEAAMMTNQLQRDSELPLLIGADFERGLSMRLYGTTVFPHAMAFGADGSPADAESSGRITGVEARAIGVHWNFFPDADVNSNPANPVINTRSFGEDPQQVGALVVGLHQGRAPGGHAGHGQAFSRARRHRHQLAPRRWRRSTATCSGCKRWSCRPSRPPSTPAWTR